MNADTKQWIKALAFATWFVGTLVLMIWAIAKLVVEGGL